MLSFPYIYKNTGSVEIVTWADGTEDQIQAMLDAAFAGKINLSDYWSVGDERVIHHSAMAATGVGESHAEQDATWVIMDTGENSGYVFEDDTPVHFVVGMKDCFNEKGYMNASAGNAGSWDGCERRTWCNNVLPLSFPEKTRNFFKPFKTVTISNGGSSGSNTLKTSIDYFALFAEKEVINTYNGGSATEAAALKHIKYYETGSNHLKNANGTKAIWLLRTPAYGNSIQYREVYDAFQTGGVYANSPYGISPFGCI